MQNVLLCHMVRVRVKVPAAACVVQALRPTQRISSLPSFHCVADAQATPYSWTLVATSSLASGLLCAWTICGASLLTYSMSLLQYHFIKKAVLTAFASPSLSF